MEYDVVLLDFDGTIAKINIFNYYNWKNNLIKTLNINYSIKTNLSPIFEDIYNLFLINKEVAEYVHNELCKVEQNSNIEIFNYTYKLIQSFYAKEIPIIIVTNNCDKAVEKTLKKIKVKQMIHSIIGRKINLEPKPNSALIKEALKNFKNISNILMIGDSKNDLLSVSSYSLEKNISFSFIWQKDICKLFRIKGCIFE